MGDHLGSRHFSFFSGRNIRKICQILLISLNYENTQIDSIGQCGQISKREFPSILWYDYIVLEIAILEISNNINCTQVSNVIEIPLFCLSTLWLQKRLNNQEMTVIFVIWKIFLKGKVSLSDTIETYIHKWAEP